MNVTNPASLAPLFVSRPAGGTPMISTLRRLFEVYGSQPRRVLVIFVTDGEPSDGSIDDLFRLLQRGRPDNVHVSLAECNDNEEEMAYLDGWDNQLKNFVWTCCHSLQPLSPTTAARALLGHSVFEPLVDVTPGQYRRLPHGARASAAGSGSCSVPSL